MESSLPPTIPQIFISHSQSNREFYLWVVKYGVRAHESCLKCVIPLKFLGTKYVAFIYAF